MQKVLTDISHLFVCPCKADTLFITVFRTFLFARKTSLLTDELLFVLSVVFVVFYYLAIAIGIELFKPDIYTYHVPMPKGGVLAAKF